MGDALPQTRRLHDTWKNGCAIKASQCPGHSTGSDHDETHSEPTLVAQRADRLHLDTFSLMRDALPQSRRSMCIWLEDRCILGGLTLHLSPFTCYMSTSGSAVQFLHSERSFAKYNASYHITPSNSRSILLLKSMTLSGVPSFF